MPVIRVCFLWHMHQPFYKDLVTGDYRLPWVRLHALKDYYGMVKLLDEFPGVKQTFNLGPSLVTQIDDYVGGSAKDPFYDVVAKPAAHLGEEERIFALRYLFQANENHLVRRYPRYAQLMESAQARNGDLRRVAANWTTQDFTDLQVLSQLAWFDEFWHEDPEIAGLVRKGKAYDSSDQQLMLEKQREILAAVLPAYRDAAQHGRIEISTTPFYHPILPLLCDTNVGRTSSPELMLPRERFRHPEDAREQLQRALDFMEERFGLRPKGVWPSEGSVSNEVLALARELGVEWMATDEGVLGRSINSYFGRDAEGKLSPECASDLYRIYRYETNEQDLGLFFRDHSLSDLIGFVYAGMEPQAAAEHFVQQLKSSAEPVLSSGRDAVVSVILDGENAWEHFPRSGREFLRRLYQLLQNDPKIEASTLAGALQKTPVEDCGRLNMITPGSWINANFDVWIGATEDNRSWDLLTAARRFYQEHAPQANEQERKLAHEELLIAEGSDWNWWYGPEHHTANDVDFDDLYRKHLANVYRALGAEPPATLAVPIAGAAILPQATPQTQFIRPRLRGAGPSYFDWLGAATYSTQAQGAMHGGQRELAALYAGFDERFLYARVDFLDGKPVQDGEIVLQAESVSLNGEPIKTGFHVLVEGGRIQRWWLARAAEEAHQPLGPNEYEDSLARLTRVLELRVQRSALGVTSEGKVRLRFTLWRQGAPTDALPREGWVTLPVLSEEQLQEMAVQSW
jgi:alpha-amylase/alpha-mannosidase (GH57 family)